MRFRVPQFLDIEDKVFGPFSFKQFLYLVAALAFMYVFWKIFSIKLFSIIFILIFSGTFLCLAFVKINSRPFSEILEAAYKFVIGNKTYIWKKEKPQENTNFSPVIKKVEKVNLKNFDSEKVDAVLKKIDFFTKDKGEKQDLEHLDLRDELLKKINENFKI